MKLLKKLTLLFFLLTCFSISLSYAQIRIVVYKTDFSQMKKSLFDEINAKNSFYLKSIADEIVRFYSNDNRFTVIDRANFSIIKDEQELQKSEEFIDGYVVEQGKQEGADYMLVSSYAKKEEAIRIRVYDVASESVKCEVFEEVKVNFGIIKKLKKNVRKLLHKVNSDCFNLTHIVVRSLDKKSGKKTKSLLIAAGRDQNIKEGAIFEIFKNVEEVVGDDIYIRKETIATGKISEVEDKNFSEMKVLSGGAEVAKALQLKEDLYCELKQ